MNVFFIALAFLVSVSSMHAGDVDLGSPKHRGHAKQSGKEIDKRKKQEKEARAKQQVEARKRAEAALVIKVGKPKQEKAVINI